MELKRVVVTGLGALTPVGNNVAETWENLVKGISGAGPITHFDASKFKTHFACEVKNFNGTDYIDRKELRKWICIHSMPLQLLKKRWRILEWTSKRRFE